MPSGPANLGPGMADYRRDPYAQGVQRPATTQPYDGRPGGGPPNPAQGRLQKPNPNMQRPVSSMSGAQMSGAQYPGPQGPRDPAAQQGWGPRTSSRPGFPPGQASRPPSEAYGRTPSGGRPERMDSLPPGAQGGVRPTPGRIETAPPGPQKPGKKPPASPTTSTTSAPARPSGQGPATFEEMGIPQGKTDGDCVSSTSDLFVFVVVEANSIP